MKKTATKNALPLTEAVLREVSGRQEEPPPQKVIQVDQQKLDGVLGLIR
jgi:hypothetical protein